MKELTKKEQRVINQRTAQRMAPRIYAAIRHGRRALALELIDDFKVHVGETNGYWNMVARYDARFPRR